MLRIKDWAYVGSKIETYNWRTITNIANIGKFL